MGRPKGKEKVMFINLTSHAIVLPSCTIQPIGIIARCEEVTTRVKILEGVEIVTKKFGLVTDLPESRVGIWLIVSMLVRTACPDRKDLLSPGDLVRNQLGQIVGCKNLVCNL